VRWRDTALDVWLLPLNQKSKHPKRCRATALQKAVKAEMQKKVAAPPTDDTLPESPVDCTRPLIV